MPEDYCEKFPQPTKRQAKAKAWSIKQALKRGAQTVSLDLPGLVQAVANQYLDLSGFRAEMNKRWIIRKVEISLNKGSGLRTRIECETPGMKSEESASSGSGGGSYSETPEE